MTQSPLWKRVLILCTILAAILFALPNLFYERVERHNDAAAAIALQGVEDRAVHRVKRVRLHCGVSRGLEELRGKFCPLWVLFG